MQHQSSWNSGVLCKRDIKIGYLPMTMKFRSDLE